MEPIGREIFWNVGETARWIAYALMVVSFVLLIYGIRARYLMWRIGKAEPIAFWQTFWRRIGSYIKSGIFHGGILRRREGYAGTMHLLIFWGFLLLAIGTALIALEDDFLRPIFGITYLHGDFYLIFSFILDLAGLAAIVGIVMALIRRYASRPERLDNQRTDMIALLWILVVLVTGFLVEAARIAYNRPSYETVSFVGWIASSLFPAKDGTTHAIIYYLHMVLSFGLIAFIVYSGRLLHIVTTSLNMMFRAVDDTPRARSRRSPISRRQRSSASTR